MTLRRDKKVFITPIYKDGRFDGYDILQDGDLKLAHNQNYFIYMKNVNLNTDGNITGRYLGEADESLIDEYCKDALYVNELGYQVEGKQIRTARMVGIKNNEDSQVIIIIE